jgi:hypothetical protein
MTKGHDMAKMSSDRADRENENWSLQAFQLFLQFARKSKSTFLTEDARQYAYLHGLKPAPDDRAWGHIAKAVEREGYIQHAGFGLAKSSNNTAKVLWKKKVKE